MTKINKYINFLRSDEFRAYLYESWSISWPMLFIMLFVFFMNLADVFVAGRLGKEYQATVGFVSQIYFVFLVIANAVTVGSVSVISKIYASSNRARLSRSVYTIVFSVIITGVLLGILGYSLTPLALHLVNVPEKVKELGAPLIKIFACGLVFHYFLINSNGILRASKMVKKSMRTMGIVCISNILMNFLLVFYTPLGFWGIALSTGLSAFLGSFINLDYVLKLIDDVRIFVVSTIKRVVSIGWPSGLTHVVWHIASMAEFLILSALPSRNIEIIAAYTNALRIEAAIFLPAFAFNLANAVVVGNLMGENRKKDAFLGGVVTSVVGVMVISLITLLVVLNAETLSMFLSDDKIVIDECIHYIYINMIGEPFMAWAVVLGGGLYGAGDTRGVLGILAISLLVVRIPLSYTMGIVAGMGVSAVWWSMNISIFVQAALVTRRYLKRKWLDYA